MSRTNGGLKNNIEVIHGWPPASAEVVGLSRPYPSNCAGALSWRRPSAPGWNGGPSGLSQAASSLLQSWRLTSNIGTIPMRSQKGIVTITMFDAGCGQTTWPRQPQMGSTGASEAPSLGSPPSGLEPPLPSRGATHTCLALSHLALEKPRFLQSASTLHCCALVSRTSEHAPCVAPNT